MNIFSIQDIYYHLLMELLSTAEVMKMEQTSLLVLVIYWLSMAVSGVIGFIYFRDLGDVSQMLFKVKRKNMLWFIRNEYRLIITGIAAALLAAILHFIAGAGGPVPWERLTL